MTTRHTLPSALLSGSDVFPAPLDTREAAAAIPIVMPHASGARHVLVRFGAEGAGVKLPRGLVQFILRILEEAAQGNAVALVPIGRELTSQQAADLLNVSRPYAIRLMEEGKLPFHKVGTHRRVRIEDLLGYRRHTDAARQKALDEMTAFDQKLGLQ